MAGRNPAIPVAGGEGRVGEEIEGFGGGGDGRRRVVHGERWPKLGETMAGGALVAEGRGGWVGEHQNAEV